MYIPSINTSKLYQNHGYAVLCGYVCIFIELYVLFQKFLLYKDTILLHRVFFYTYITASLVLAVVLQQCCTDWYSASTQDQHAAALLYSDQERLKCRLLSSNSCAMISLSSSFCDMDIQFSQKVPLCTFVHSANLFIIPSVIP